MDILMYLLYAIGAGLLLVMVLPIPKLIIHKLKFGKQVEIFYFPFFGILARIIYDGIRHRDVFYTQKRYLINNPDMKLHVTSDLKGGVHYSLVDAKLKKQIFSEQENYKKMEGLPFSDVFVDQGILFQSGPKWASGRKLLAQHFTFESLKIMVLSLKERCKLVQLDGPVNILEIAKDLSSEVITQAFFGLNNEVIKSLASDVNSLLGDIMGLFTNPLVLIRCFVFKLNKGSTPSWLLSSKERKFLKRLQAQKQLITQEINTRIEQIKNKEQVDNNILTTLANSVLQNSLPVEEAIHQYFTLLLAGIDSTSHLIKNCCYALALHQDVQDKLRSELKIHLGDYDNLTASLLNIKYLNNFIDESLRHYTPTVSLFNRVTKDKRQLGPFTFEAGQSVDLNFIMSNFDPKVFQNPLEFNVDRWNNPLDDPFSFTPFSSAFIINGAESDHHILGHALPTNIKPTQRQTGIRDALRSNRSQFLGDQQNQMSYLVLTGQNEQALQQLDGSFESLIAKSIALQNLGRFPEARTAVESALAIDHSRFETYFRLAQLNFFDGRVEEAQSDIEQALKLNTNHEQSQTLKKKITTELSNPKYKSLKVDQSKEKQAQRTEIVSATGKLLYRWYQTDIKVGIEILYGLKNKDDLKCVIEAKHLQLSFPLEQNVFDLDLDLFDEVIVESSKSKVGLQQIEIILDKKVKGHNWSRLEAIQTDKVPEQQTAYPTSSLKKKDWSKIDKEIEEDISKHKEEYGEDPLNSLFRQIYQNGDEETRRAMIKSMQTSGGTVLSTNWGEVKEKDYEGKDRPAPPSGQEAKKMI